MGAPVHTITQIHSFSWCLCVWVSLLPWYYTWYIRRSSTFYDTFDMAMITSTGLDGNSPKIGTHVWSHLNLCSLFQSRYRTRRERVHGSWSCTSSARGHAFVVKIIFTTNKRKNTIVNILCIYYLKGIVLCCVVCSIDSCRRNSNVCTFAFDHSSTLAYSSPRWEKSKGPVVSSL